MLGGVCVININIIANFLVRIHPTVALVYNYVPIHIIRNRYFNDNPRLVNIAKFSFFLNFIFSLS